MEENLEVVEDGKQFLLEEKTSSKNQYLRTTCIVILAIIFGTTNRFYVSELFENDRNFSHLSTLEREMSFYSETGFYYSFYKTIVEERPFLAGISKILYDKTVEYPNEINAFNRFNIHPEVMLGALYRYWESHLNTSRECHMVYRGPSLEPVQSCVGLGEPIYWYLEAIWWLAGLTVGTLFVYATVLSNSILGAMFTIAQYFANHSEATRVMWSPSQRENMTQPLLMMQMCLVTVQLRRARGHGATLPLQIGILVLNCLCLLFWQFTQFIFLTQTAIFFVMEQLGIISLKSFCIFLHSHFCGLHMAILLLQGNDMIKTSLYSSFFLVVSAYSLFLGNLRITIKNNLDLMIECWLVVLRILIVISMSLWLKSISSSFLQVDEDSHIWEILYSKFSSYKNFHTMLYTCSAVFDFASLSFWKSVTFTSLLPSVTVVLFNILTSWYICCKKEFKLRKQHQESTKQEISENNDSGEDSGIENNMSDTKHDKEKKDTDKVQDLDEINEKIKEKLDEKYTEAKKKYFKLKNNESNVSDVVLFMESLDIDPALFYNVSQMLVYGIMAAIIMRLKLLFVPQMCLVSSLLFNTKLISYGGVPKKIFILILVPVLISATAYSITKTVEEELSILGSYSNPSLEELLTWIWSRSPPSGVFAASMPLTSTILLTTRRAILNHPHYEHKAARLRNYAVYKMYGRFPPSELYHDLNILKATYLVLEKKYCYVKSTNGCSYTEIWDEEVPTLKHRPKLCETLDHYDLDHFYSVFENNDYIVFKIHDVSVRYMPRAFDT